MNGKKKKLGSILGNLFRRSSIDDSFFEDMEDTLIEGDIGSNLAVKIVDELRLSIGGKTPGQEELMEQLRSLLFKRLVTGAFEPELSALNVVLVLGVNGVGKTTTIAKMAHFYKQKGIGKIVLAAADTFRAAAADQLKLHGERLGLRVVAQDHGADPGAVVHDALESAIARKEELVLVDTAGRMHNKDHLVRELRKIDKIITKFVPEERVKRILVLDATTGQNAVQQAASFGESISIDGCILTKFDSTAGGGAALSICDRYSLPFYFLGKGEGADDLVPFDAHEYLERLLG